VLLPYGRFFDPVVQNSSPKLGFLIKTAWWRGGKSKSVCQTGLIKHGKPIALFCINAELDN
jgi:predicted transcriptional regulator YheO